MKAKHTTGPWIACEYGDYADYDGNCTVVLGEGGDIRTAIVLGFDTPENQANAQLIAAAPDMLRVLQEIVGVFSAFAYKPEPGSLTKKAQDVIDKALGVSK